MKNQHILLLSLVLLSCQPLCLVGKPGGQRNKAQKKATYELQYPENNDFIDATKELPRIISARPSTDTNIRPAVQILPPPQSDTNFSVIVQPSAEVEATFENISETKTQAVPGSLDKRLRWWWGAQIRKTTEGFMETLTPEFKFGSGIVGENKRWTSAAFGSYKNNGQPDQMIALLEFLNKHKTRPEIPVADSGLITTEYKEYISTHLKNIDCQLEKLEPQVEQAGTLQEKKNKISTIMAAITIAEQK